MKKYVFYPILFSISPILLLLGANISNWSISQLFPIILITPVCSIGLMWILYKWLKDIHRAGFIVFLITFWFFYYTPIRVWANTIHIGSISFGGHLIFFPLWTLVFIIFSSGWLWRRITSPETITMFLNLVSIIVIVFSILRISLDLAPRYLTRPDTNHAIQSLPRFPSNIKMPDIYYIILDGYAREDVLNTLYHYDNSSFIQALEERGFFIASQSQSNYIQTALSLASSMNMEYLSGLSAVLPDRGQLIGMIRHSRVRAIFEHLGYKVVTFSTGYQPTEINDADYFLSSPKLGKSHDLEAQMLANSVAVILVENDWIDLPISRYSTAQERIIYAFANLENEVPISSGPKMVFAHIIAPHPPFIFDQNGSVSPDEFYVLQDGDHFWGRRDEYIQEYAGQLVYVNNRILLMVDGILANSKSPPIIIIQADHGPGAFLDWTSDKNTCLKERISIFNAFYLPQQGIIKFPKDLTPVNTFRLIFNTYFSTHFELLDNKEYYSTWDHPFDFVDITAESQATCDLP
jgi:hypothetical protein